MQKLPPLIVGVLSLGAAASGQVVLSGGHVDIGVGYSSLTGWDLHIHDEDGGLEYAPDEAILEVGAAGYGFLPNDPAFGALAGAAAWTLPKNENPALLFLGIGAEELETGVFAGDTAELLLLGAQGPGSFLLWADDGLGGFEIFSTGSVVNLVAGQHTHYNWSFTAVGTYTVDLIAGGILVGGGTITSDVGTYTFSVVPEPSTWALLAGCVALMGAFAHRRFRRG